MATGGWEHLRVSGPRAGSLRTSDGVVLAVVAAASALLLGFLGGAVGLSVVALTGGSAPAISAVVENDRPGPAPRAPDTVAGVVSDTLPSVASVIVDAGFESGSGSGFVIREDGYLVTNSHVIDAALVNDGSVEVVLSDGRRIAAGVVGRNVSYDVAVLRVEDRALVPLTAARSPAAVGDSVIVIGAPLGYDFTVTTGIVSSLDRPVTVGEAEGASYISAIQTDAPINPGNSGGPVVDGEGRFIGMASSMATLARGAGSRAGSIGLGFAIPARAVERIAEEIIATGASRTPIMGISLDTSYTGPGALIGSVTPGGPAQRAGLRGGDVILRLGSRDIGDADELVVAIRDSLPGEQVDVIARRGVRDVLVTVTLGSRRDR
jgi:putative serine protease PepD